MERAHRHVALGTYQPNVTTLRSAYGMSCPSVVCLSSVHLSLLHARQRLGLFDNIFAPPNTSGTRTVCIKILGKNSNEFQGSYKLNTSGIKNWRFSTNSSLISKTVQDAALVTVEDEQELVCNLSNDAISKACHYSTFNISNTVSLCYY